MNNTLKNKKLFLLDMDGTIYLEDDLFDGTLDFLAHVRESGGRYLFLTNNSSKGIDKYTEKLARLGIESTPDDFLTSTEATIAYLKEKNHNKIYAFGTASFKKQLADAGLSITDRLEDGIDCLCIANDWELTFKKLEDSCILLKNDIDYIATNPDWVCPVDFGYIPDCGSMCFGIEKATGKSPVYIGKPQPQMIFSAMEMHGFTKEQTVVLGDRLYTDIASGVNAGVDTILVLSGEATVKDLEASPVKPTYVLNSVSEIKL